MACLTVKLLAFLFLAFLSEWTGAVMWMVQFVETLVWPENCLRWADARGLRVGYWGIWTGFLVLGVLDLRLFIWKTCVSIIVI